MNEIITYGKPLICIKKQSQLEVAKQTNSVTAKKSQAFKLFREEITKQNIFLKYKNYVLNTLAKQLFFFYLD